MEPKWLKSTCIVFCILGMNSLVNAQYTVTRGPYIQLVSQNSLFIRWRTNLPTDSKVSYGTIATSQTSIVSIPTLTTEHEVQVTGLSSDTKYYYSVGHSGGNLSVAPDQYFYTLPPDNTIRPYTFWVVGDCGTADDNQRAVRDSYLNYIGNERVYGMIMLGDNAYYSGTDNEYQGALFNNMYEDIVSNTSMHPSPGNHDYYSGADATTQTGPYYDLFTLPSAGQLGGFPSGTEAYYSYDIGNIHFISLDSYDSGRDSTNAMGTWLKQDLLNNTKEWTIAYWHHPPYSKGNHNSDNPSPYIDSELQQMREQILPLIEKGGVDLVLCGHSHAYERTYLMDGHYGSSSTYNSSHQIDAGSGNFITDCPYVKKTVNGKSHQGTVYTVCGVSGKTSPPGAGWPHPAMYKASTGYLGSMILTIHANRLDAKFITSTDSVYDQFTIFKNAGGQQDLWVCNGNAIDLIPSFPNPQYVWTPGGIHSPTFSVYPFDTTIFYGSDELNCVKDTFNIMVITQGAPGDTCDWDIGIEPFANELVYLHPNPVSKSGSGHIFLNNIGNVQKVEWIDIRGKSVGSEEFQNGFSSVKIPPQLEPGIYMLKFTINNSLYLRKLILVD